MVLEKNIKTVKGRRSVCTAQDLSGAANLRACPEDYSALVCERDAVRFVSFAANFSKLIRFGGLFRVSRLQKKHLSPLSVIGGIINKSGLLGKSHPDV